MKSLSIKKVKPLALSLAMSFMFQNAYSKPLSNDVQCFSHNEEHINRMAHISIIPKDKVLSATKAIADLYVKSGGAVFLRGTAFFIDHEDIGQKKLDNEHYVMTNLHNIKDVFYPQRNVSFSLRVQDKNADVYEYKADPVYVSPSIDLAILKIHSDKNFYSIALNHDGVANNTRALILPSCARYDVYQDMNDLVGTVVYQNTVIKSKPNFVVSPLTADGVGGQSGSPFLDSSGKAFAIYSQRQDVLKNNRQLELRYSYGFKGLREKLSGLNLLNHSIFNYGVQTQNNVFYYDMLAWGKQRNENLSNLQERCQRLTQRALTLGGVRYLSPELKLSLHISCRKIPIVFHTPITKQQNSFLTETLNLMLNDNPNDPHIAKLYASQLFTFNNQEFHEQALSIIEYLHQNYPWIYFSPNMEQYLNACSENK